jgi:hypothetical protein
LWRWRLLLREVEAAAVGGTAVRESLVRPSVEPWGAVPAEGLHSEVQEKHRLRNVLLGKSAVAAVAEQRAARGAVAVLRSVAAGRAAGDRLGAKVLVRQSALLGCCWVAWETQQ